MSRVDGGPLLRDAERDRPESLVLVTEVLHRHVPARLSAVPDRIPGRRNELRVPNVLDGVAATDDALARRTRRDRERESLGRRDHVLGIGLGDGRRARRTLQPGRSGRTVLAGRALHALTRRLERPADALGVRWQVLEG